MSAINPISNPLAAWQSGLANRAGSASTPGNVIRVRPIPANPFAGGTGQVQPTDPARPTRDPGQADRARSTSADRPGPRTGSVYQTNADGDSVTLSSKQLSPEEQEEVQKLQTRDREVRTHEEAHKAAAAVAKGLTAYGRPAAKTTREALCEAFCDLAADRGARKHMAERGPAAIDGKGPQRTARALCAMARTAAININPKTGKAAQSCR